MARPTIGKTAILLVVLGLSACTKHENRFEQRQVTINAVRVTGTDATTLRLTVNNCGTDSPDQYQVDVQQTDSTVRLTVRGPVWLGEDEASCLDGTKVDLGRPLGDRTVIDQSNHHKLEVTIRP